VSWTVEIMVYDRDGVRRWSGTNKFFRSRLEAERWAETLDYTNRVVGFDYE